MVIVQMGKSAMFFGLVLLALGCFVGNSEMGYTKITGAQPYFSFKQTIETYLQ